MPIFDNLDEKDKFLDKCNLSNLIKGKIIYLNTPISIK